MTPSHSAHVDSLYLFQSILRAIDIPVWNAVEIVRKAIELNHLEADVEIVIVIDGQGSLLNIEPKTEFGEAVCVELTDRCKADLEEIQWECLHESAFLMARG